MQIQSVETRPNQAKQANLLGGRFGALSAAALALGVGVGRTQKVDADDRTD